MASCQENVHTDGRHRLAHDALRCLQQLCGWHQVLQRVQLQAQQLITDSGNTLLFELLRNGCLAVRGPQATQLAQGILCVAMSSSKHATARGVHERTCKYRAMHTAARTKALSLGNSDLLRSEVA